MDAVAPQEAHELAQPVADAEAEVLNVEIRSLLHVRRVQHDVGQGGRDGFAAVELAGGAFDDVGGHLDGPAVEVEEPEAVTAAGALQGPRFADQLDARGSEPLGHGVDAGFIGRGEGDDVQPLLGRLAQAKDVRLARPFGRQPGEVRSAIGLLQAPGAAHELTLGFEVGNRQPDVAQGGDAVLSHLKSPAFPPAGPAAAINRRTGPREKLQFGIPDIEVGYRAGAQ